MLMKDESEENKNKVRGVPSQSVGKSSHTIDLSVVHIMSPNRPVESREHGAEMRTIQ